MKLTLLALEKDDLLRIGCEGSIARLLDQERDPLRELLGPHCYSRRVLFNMERVQSVDTSGITWLLTVVERFARDSGRVVFFAVPPIVTQVLDFMRLTDTLPLAASEQAAAAMAFANGSAPAPASRPEPRPGDSVGSPQ
jgi:anti-anti-sigma regulatory factor